MTEGEMDAHSEAIGVLKRSRILIVDDDIANVRVLERLYSTVGYSDVLGLSDSRRAIEVAEALSPDLVVLDLRMPHVNGFAILKRLKGGAHEGDILPVIVLTADASASARKEALALGATEFLTKPFRSFDILLRTRNLLQIRHLHLQVQERNRSLEERVRERTRELEGAHAEVLERLVQAIEVRDGETGMHTRRVGENSAMLAEALGLSPDEVELIRRAAPLHDLGKIGIPDSILLKPGRLSADEFEIVKTHASVGAGILAEGRSDIMRVAERIALAHHERWNGTGYPNGLKGPEIPIEARIVAAVDVFDALTHARCYREAWSRERVREEIRKQSGEHFDPEVANALLDLDGRDQLLR